MALKITLFFNQDQQGWTEVFYSNENNPYSFLNSVPTNFWRAASKFRAYGTDLFAARATQIGGARVNYSLSLTGKYSPLTKDPILNVPQITADVLLVKLRSSTGETRPLYLRGLAYADVVRFGDGSPNPSGRLLSSVADYVSAMKLAGLCIQKGNRPAAGAVGWYYPIDVVPNVGLGSSNVVMSAIPAGIVPGVPILFQGVNRNWLPGFPKITLVNGVNDTAPAPYIRISYLYRGASNPQFQRAGFRFCVYSNNFQAITSYTTAQFTTHKTGRPFGEPRGRLRAVVKAQ